MVTVLRQFLTRMSIRKKKYTIKIKENFIMMVLTSMRHENNDYISFDFYKWIIEEICHDFIQMLNRLKSQHKVASNRRVKAS